MFSWITGPRITNVIEDLQTGATCNTVLHARHEADNILDADYDTTFIEPPETPAHQFAVKAFKHAIFGTPAPEEAKTGKKLEKKTRLDTANAKATDLPAPKENAPTSSPSKQPKGVLMTPGTANKGRKTVSFGAHVVDNEGKKGNIGKSGIPNDCPGKFPSPWTPGTELKVDPASDTKPRTKLTAALYDARTATQPKPGQKPKARDDSDITIDLGAPRSDSGKYWKEQYETYAERSEKQMKQLVAKQQMAKNYAKKKDGEAIEAATRLAEERKRFRNRERELEQQNKDYQERLRQAMAENCAASVEITALKNRIAALEKSLTAPSSDFQNSRMTFQIFEDSNKDSSHLVSLQEKKDRSHMTMEPRSMISSKYVQSSSLLPDNKENSPPKARHARRQTISESTSRPTRSHSTPRPTTSHSTTSRPAVESLNASRPSAVTMKAALASLSSDVPLKSPSNARRPEPAKENFPPKSPAKLLSSPLPQPSPDPWMNANDSPAPAMDRMAMPISSGPSYTRPVKTLQARHRTSRSVAQAQKIEAQKAERFITESEEARKLAAPETKTETSKSTTALTGEKPITHDLKWDFAKLPTNTADGSSQIARDRKEIPEDRKEQAKRRLEERRLKKQGS